MSLEPRCPKTPKDRKKKPKPHSLGDCGGSTYAKQKIGLFQAEIMMKCIAEINKVEAKAKRHGTKPKSRNRICRDYGLSLSPVSKRISSDITLSYVSLEEMPSEA